MSLGPGTSELTPTLVDPPRMPARVETVRRQFERRAARFAEHDAVVREAERRLAERLDVIRIAPERIADVGCGAGRSHALLSARYPQAQWIGLDLSTAMLRAAGPTGVVWPHWLAQWLPGRLPRALRACAEGGALPLAPDSVDLVFSNLMLHWHPQPHAVFPEWKRVLRTGGLLLFSCFGPDTLKELRAAVVDALPRARPLPFVDMHDFGDMLVGGGFATPVMDVEVLRLTYPSPQALLREVRALGGNPCDDRDGVLPSGRQARRLLAALGARAGDDGRIDLTFEIAFGHAWKEAPRPPSRREASVPVDALRAQLRRRR